MRQDRIEQWSRYVRATGIDAMFVGEEWADYLSTQVYYAAARGQRGPSVSYSTKGRTPTGTTPRTVSLRSRLRLG